MSHPSSDMAIDVLEHGAPRDGQPQSLDRRLFMQLLVFGSGPEQNADKLMKNLASRLTEAHANAVIYEDVNNPRGLGLLSWNEDPGELLSKVRDALGADAFQALSLRPEMTMLGRTYSSGFEPDLEYWLLKRPDETARNPAWPWAVWYPLRRGGAFERLERRERSEIMREHAAIGKAYGAQDLAHDIRLACHGLDANDNEFVIGLIGKDLHPLSHVIQAMRKTRQTSEFIVQMGPFFVGRAVFRTPSA